MFILPFIGSACAVMVQLSLIVSPDRKRRRLSFPAAAFRAIQLSSAINAPINGWLRVLQACPGNGGFPPGPGCRPTAPE
jgi:hypothetical protein